MYLCQLNFIYLFFDNKVRFMADLVNSKVIPISSIISLFDTLITVTYEPGISQVSLFKKLDSKF